MSHSELFKGLHGLLNLDYIQPISKSLTREEIDYAIKELDIEGYNLFYNPNGLYPYFYYDGTMFYEFMNIKDLKMFSNVPNGDRTFDEDYRFKYQREYIQKMLDKGDYEGVINFADKKVRFYVFCELYKKLPDTSKLNLFLEIYQSNEYGFEFMDRETLDELFTYPLNAEFHLNKSEYKPDENGYYIIYRGETEKSTPWTKAYSWTFKPETAIFFGTRFNSKPTIYKARVHKDNIKAYLDGRGEEEVLVYPEHIEDAEKVDLSGAFNS